MADLISRAAAKKIVSLMVCAPSVKIQAEHSIDDLPAVDAVPVVRCRDCKFGKPCIDADGHSLIQCTNPNYPTANVETWPLELDWYCAGGKRRDGDT